MKSIIPHIRMARRNSKVFKLRKILILAFPILFLFLSSCGGSDDTPTPQPFVVTPSFTFDNENYSVLSSQGINEIKQTGFFTFNDVPYTRSSITIIGLIGFSKSATLSFDLFYREGQSIAGTYTIYDTDDSDAGFESFLSPLMRGCMGWTSLGTAFVLSSEESVNANNPTGTVKITVNGANNYTIQYTGNYRIYDDNFHVVRNVPCSMNVTGTVVQQG